VSYHLRLPVYDEHGVPAGFFSSEALHPEQLTFHAAYVESHPLQFENVSGSWYHLDAEGNTTHPAHTTG
jgi:hypothetical protein